MTIQMKATEQDSSVVLFIMLYVVLSHVLFLWIKSSSVIIQTNFTEQNFPVVLFIMLNEKVLNFKSANIKI